jgi:hypothetical protein
MTGRLSAGSMTRVLVLPSAATTAAAVPGHRSVATTVLTHRHHRVTVRAPVSAGMVRHEGATGHRTRHEVVIDLRMQHEGATGRRTRHEEAIDHRMRVVVTGRRTRREAATTVLVRHFGATTVADGRRFVATTVLTSLAHRVTVMVNTRTAGTDRSEEATDRRTPHEGAVRGRLRLVRAALGLAARAETTTRGRYGTRATRRGVAGPSQRGRAGAALRTDREAGPPSGRDHLGAEGLVANGAEQVVGRALAEDRRHASAHRGRTATPAAMRAGRRIGVEEQGVRRGDEAGRAGRRATRRDGLVAARDL